MGMPTYCQIEIRASVVNALDSCPSQGWNQPLRPTVARMVGATPQRGLRMSFQEKPTITNESMVGRKKAVR